MPQAFECLFTSWCLVKNPVVVSVFISVGEIVGSCLENSKNNGQFQASFLACVTGQEGDHQDIILHATS